METAGSPPSFERDIRPLFRSIDVDHMSPMGVLLDDYEYMSEASNAQGVYDYLAGRREPRMPPKGPYWSDEQLALYARWMSEGRKA